jgi:hypothetical protein
MKVEVTTNLPCCGNSARDLGVRVNVDISPDQQNNVHPKTGGMSAFLSPQSLPIHRKPITFGGIGKDPVYSIDSASLTKYDLEFINDNKIREHVVIGPHIKMSITELQQKLCQSKPEWGLCI